MPCGGIYPMRDIPKEIECFYCGDIGTTHMIEEWDAFIHERCIDDFLKTPEDEIIISHGHLITK
jgi:hypothetical protein